MDSRQQILKVYSEHEGMPISTRDLVRQLSMHGVKVAERTLRYHLKILDASGLTENLGKPGRRITTKGMDTIEKSSLADLDFVRNHYYNLACTTTLDTQKNTGNVILNAVLLHKDRLASALKHIEYINGTPYMIGNRVMVAREGQSIGGEIVPQGMVALGVICSASVLGILIKEGIPAMPSYIGLLDMHDGEPELFSSLIGLQSISQDVLSIYLKGAQTDVSGVLRTGTGRVIAMFIEMPAACTASMENMSRSHALVSAQAIGVASSRLLDIPVGAAKAGAVILDGLNAIAYLHERGINTESRVLMMPYEYSEMTEIEEAAASYAVQD